MKTAQKKPAAKYLYDASKGALVALIAAWLTEKVSLLGTVATLAVARVGFAWAQSPEDGVNQLAEILSYRPDMNEGMLGLFVIVFIGFVAYRVHERRGQHSRR